jgi:hypothetical protein
MFELTIDTEVRGLQSIAETGGLYRYGRRRSYYGGYGRRNSCLVTGNHSLNGINILNILNGFGGGW